MIPYEHAGETVAHGGDLDAARRLFPGAVEPFIDLSTGINPNPYPLPRLSADLFARLPSPAAVDALAAIAAQAYGAPSAAHVVPAPGTQILLPLVAALIQPGRAVLLTPSYGEFARAAALAGHQVKAADELDACAEADLVMIANPNNPDGSLLSGNSLRAFAEKNLRPHGGMLVVDEAFMDVGPRGASVAADVAHGDVVVLRSFGKFFGLAGARLGFALAVPTVAKRLRATLGPWAVSGPALAFGAKALTDKAWIERTRRQLAQAAERLDTTLESAGLEILGGTSLFRLARTPAANALFQHLGRAGIFVRTFPDNTSWLRFGLPPHERAWRRLQAALASFAGVLR
jgi:cobalamin biosynthetic protein CobC